MASSPLTIASSTPPAAELTPAQTITSSSAPSTVYVAPVLEVSGSEPVEVSSATSGSSGSVSDHNLEILQPQAEAAEAAQRAVEARLRLAEARSSQATPRALSIAPSTAPSVRGDAVERFDISDDPEADAPVAERGDTGPTEENHNEGNFDVIIEGNNVVLPLDVPAS